MSIIEFAQQRGYQLTEDEKEALEKLQEISFTNQFAPLSIKGLSPNVDAVYNAWKKND